MMNIQKFTKKPFDVEAVQITVDNLSEVAEWSNGRVHENHTVSLNEVRFIEVDVQHAINKRQTQAYVGDWVLKSKRGFKIYTDAAFRAYFRPTEVRVITGVEDIQFVNNDVAVINDPEFDLFRDGKVSQSILSRNLFNVSSQNVREERQVSDKDAIAGKQ